jgi:hypothetical protein
MSVLDGKKSVVLDVKKSSGQIQVKVGTKKSVGNKVASLLEGKKASQ